MLIGALRLTFDFWKLVKLSKKQTF